MRGSVEPPALPLTKGPQPSVTCSKSSNTVVTGLVGVAEEVSAPGWLPVPATPWPLTETDTSRLAVPCPTSVQALAS